MDLRSRILVTGGNGLLGTALKAKLTMLGYTDVLSPTSTELNLLDLEQLQGWFDVNQPEYVFHLASLVYGLRGNMDNQLKSIHRNTTINLNLFSVLSNSVVKKVFFAGTVASYPYPYASLPLEEKFFFNGEPHEGEYGYAVSKRFAYSYLKILKETKGLEFCYGVFTNLYGENDRFDEINGHVIPSLIKKSLIAISTNEKQLNVWGNPSTSRDFLNSKDAAAAAILCMIKGVGIINISSGIETCMSEIVSEIVQYYDNCLNVIWDANAPVGVPNRSVSNELLKKIGFSCEVSIRQGISESISWLEKNYHVGRR